jgi:hypothetical protein
MTGKDKIGQTKRYFRETLGFGVAQKELSFGGKVRQN